MNEEKHIQQGPRMAECVWTCHFILLFLMYMFILIVKSFNSQAEYGWWHYFNVSCLSQLSYS